MQPNSETYSCRACTKIFSTKEDLEEHSEWHNLQKEYIPNPHVKLERVSIFKCGTCTRGFLNQNVLTEHENKCLKNDLDSTSEDNNNKFVKSYKCEHCDWRFVKKSTLDTHSIIHKPFPNICECGIGYYKKQDLDSHRRLVHSQSKPTAPKLTPKIQYKTDSELEVSDNEDGDNSRSKVRPRLKAELYYKTKQKRKKQNKIKRSYKKDKENVAIEQNESGQFICPICANTFATKKCVTNHINLIHNSERQYACIECPKKYSSPRQLAEHKKRHAGIKDYPCSVCHKSFYTKAYSERHMMIHTGEKPFACHLCPRRFTQINTLKNHIFTHTGERNYKCEACNKRFLSKERLKRHAIIHSGQKPFECRRCGKGFADPSARGRHELTHTGRRPHRCARCPAAFCDISALRAHSLRHAGVTFPCAVCGIVYKRRSQMVNHINSVHSETQSTYECDHCARTFNFKPYLVNHIKLNHMNTGVRVECEICGAKVAPVGLKRHLLQVHVKNFTHECELCGKPFLHKSEMRQHMLRHDKTRDRNYECDYCHRGYPNKHEVWKHIVTKHLGIQCEMCNKAFSTSLKLKLHKSKGCWRCPVCHLPFAVKHIMEHHITVHHVPRSERMMYECEHCSKQFPIKTRLRTHIRKVHEEVKITYSCDHCNGTFKNKDVIRNHIWDRHMLSLYCDVCLKRFYNEAEFSRHKRAGCTLKQLPCTFCNKIFSSNNTLRSHLSSHFPKRMECATCGVKYKTRSELLRHIKSAHGLRKRCKKIR